MNYPSVSIFMCPDTVPATSTVLGSAVHRWLLPRHRHIYPEHVRCSGSTVGPLTLILTGQIPMSVKAQPAPYQDTNDGDPEMSISSFFPIPSGGKFRNRR